MTTPTRSTTARGFAIYDEFMDSRGSEVRVQLSSAASVGVEGGPFVWIWCKPDGDRDGDCNDPLHLTIAQARRVRDALNTFIRENK